MCKHVSSACKSDHRSSAVTSKRTDKDLRPYSCLINHQVQRPCFLDAPDSESCLINAGPDHLILICIRSFCAILNYTALSV